MRGIVTGMTDHGTIITMHIEGREGDTLDLHFDHRSYVHMEEVERDNIVGREVDVQEEAGIDGPVIVFDPDPEWADVEQDQVAPDH